MSFRPPPSFSWYSSKIVDQHTISTTYIHHTPFPLHTTCPNHHHHRHHHSQAAESDDRCTDTLPDSDYAGPGAVQAIEDTSSICNSKISCEFWLNAFGNSFSLQAYGADGQGMNGILGEDEDEIPCSQPRAEVYTDLTNSQ
jgi:hypothetical protein